MITANELRVGNWIFLEKNGNKNPYQIWAHDIEEIEGNGEDCFPVPLTPFILGKCVGQKRIDRSEWVVNGLRVCLCFDGKYRIITNLFDLENEPDVSCLHMLQNAVRFLTGQELEVKL